MLLLIQNLTIRVVSEKKDLSLQKTKDARLSLKGKYSSGLQEFHTVKFYRPNNPPYMKLFLQYGTLVEEATEKKGLLC